MAAALTESLSLATRADIERSYTPNLDGAPPSIVMEFISATDGGEYSIKSTHPPVMLRASF